MRDQMLVMRHWLENIKKNGTLEQIKEVYYRIMEYGIFEKKHPSEDPVVNIALDSVYTQIDIMQEKYEQDKKNGRRGGRPVVVDNGKIWKLAREGKSGIEISTELGIPKTTVYSSEGWRQRKNLDWEEE